MSQFENTPKPPLTPTGDLGPARFLGVVALALVAAMVIVYGLSTPQGPASGAYPLLGQPMPALEVAGWLNGPGPTPEQLKGQVIVLDAWAFWCGPCRAKAPELVAVQKAYAPKGVVFIGLTGEGESALKESEAFLAATKIDWPNGYGAVGPLNALNAEYIPQLWVIDRSGKIAWHDSANEELSAALDRLLAEPIATTTAAGASTTP